jgi:hypothetical protein
MILQAICWEDAQMEDKVHGAPVLAVVGIALSLGSLIIGHTLTELQHVREASRSLEVRVEHRLTRIEGKLDRIGEGLRAGAGGMRTRRGQRRR